MQLSNLQMYQTYLSQSVSDICLQQNTKRKQRLHISVAPVK
jgi:hypothetical protein